MAEQNVETSTEAAEPAAVAPETHEAQPEKAAPGGQEGFIRNKAVAEARERVADARRKLDSAMKSRQTGPEAARKAENGAPNGAATDKAPEKAPQEPPQAPKPPDPPKETPKEATKTAKEPDQAHDPVAKALETLRKEQMLLNEEKQKIRDLEKELEPIRKLKGAKSWRERISALGGDFEQVAREYAENPESADVRTLREEIQSLKSDLDSRQKQQAELEWSKTLMGISSGISSHIQANADKYEQIAARGDDAVRQATELYVQAARETGGVVPLDQLLDKYEDELYGQDIRLAQTKKVQAAILARHEKVKAETEAAKRKAADEEAAKKQAERPAANLGTKQAQRPSDKERLERFMRRVFKE